MNILFRQMDQRWQYLYSAGIIILVSAICFAFSGVLDYRVPAFILLLAVSILAIIFDIFPVLLAAALSALVWDLFFIPPLFTLHVDNAEDSFLLIMYFIIAMINAVLTFKIRQAEKITRLKEERAGSVKLYNTVLDSLSHELRTPIAAIIAATDILQTPDNYTKEEQKQLISEISRASLRLNQQVENLLNISRLESGHIKPNEDWCDIVELVYDVVRRVEENNKGRKINISVDQSLPLCRTDKGMLDQIMYNLLNNAAIHTEPTCRIAITATVHTDLLQFIIEDNGKGFTSIELKDIFNKFSRHRNPKTGGSGLGLSIVKGFTEAIGGTVDINTSFKEGAQFIISIPVKTSYYKVYDNE